MRIALAQIDTTVGAFSSNSALMVERAKAAAAQGAQLVLFPELALSGYPPKDLLELREFVDECHSSLVQLSKDGVFDRVAALVGFPERHDGPGAGLYNAAALIQKGGIAAVARKSLLPTYDVFDEGRYFDPAPQPTLVEIAGGRVRGEGRAWGEDWSVADLHVEGRAAPAAPPRAQPATKPGSVISPATTEAPSGALAVVAAYESELNDETCRDLADALTLGIRDYALKTGFKSVVLGLSGGIDSALTAVLAARALGPQNVTTIALPSPYTASMSNEDAELLANRLGVRFHTIAIEPIFRAYLEALKPIFKDAKPDVSVKNLQ